jgi:predicted  nucleic acid-binding Zn-ribbon protein
MSQLEYELDETRNELQTKLRQLAEFSEQINDLKVEVASVREQKNSAMKEVSSDTLEGRACVHV